MLTCKRCGCGFEQYVVIDDKMRNLKSRSHCLDCHPWTGKSGARRQLLTEEDRQQSKLNAQLRHLYGIDVNDLAKMQTTQNNECAICRRGPPNTYKKRLSIDHCHTTGTVRGLLCTRCNSMLGWLEDHRQAVEEYLS